MRLKPGKTMVIGDLTLIIIEQLSINASDASHGLWVNARKEPYALVIQDSQGLRVLDMQGKDLPIGTLSKHSMELASIFSQ